MSDTLLWELVPALQRGDWVQSNKPFVPGMTGRSQVSAGVRGQVTDVDEHAVYVEFRNVYFRRRLSRTVNAVFAFSWYIDLADLGKEPSPLDILPKPDHPRLGYNNG